MKQLRPFMALFIGASMYAGTAQAQSSLLQPAKKTKPYQQQAMAVATQKNKAKPASVNMQLIARHTKQYDGVSFTETIDSTRYYYGSAIGVGDLGYEKDLLFHLMPQTPADILYYWAGIGGAPEASWAIGPTLDFPGDSITLFENNGGSLARAAATKYSYNTDGFIDQIETEDVSDPGYNERKLISYDTEHRITSEIFQHWQSGAWKNYIKFIYVYNVSGQLENRVYQTWSSGAWENYTSLLYSYDGSGNIASVVDRVWSGSAWTNNMKNTVTHSTDGVIQDIVSQFWTAGAWKNQEKWAVTVHTGGQVNTYTNYDWEGGAWLPYNQVVYSNAAGQATGYIQSAYDETTSSWEAEVKISYAYAEGFLSAISAYMWDDAASAWEAFARVPILRNSAGLMTSYWEEEWNTGGFWEIPVDGARVYLTYEEAPLAVPAFAKDMSFRLYPNPATDKIHIQTGGQSVERISIRDGSGRLMFETKGAVSGAIIRIPVAQLAPGVYIMQVQGSGAMATKRFVVQ